MAKIPERIGKYEVIRRLGYGGMGTVYLARDPDLDRLLAVKVLRDLFEDELIQRFLREARSAGNLRHDNIITVYDAGQHEHQPFMAMEYVDGTSLAGLIKVRQPLPLVDKLGYLEQICAGLHYAHSRGIVHRDIKPANLMVDRRHCIRILDFGIARVEGSGMTRDGSLIGTLNYMSPEQMLGRPVDHRSDIFAFGAVAYELISYHRAFPGSVDDGLLHRLPHESPPPLAELCPDLPDGIEPLVMRALAKLPDDRFGDLEEAALAFRNIRRQLDPAVDVEPTTFPKRSRAGATPTPGTPSERRDFLERRAHQIAYHLDAARKAQADGDLDAAAAACEDVLTLDPEDRGALQLLAEIEVAQERQGVESKERRERERTIRRHLADADLKLSRGDVDTAVRLVQQALTLDPGNAAALSLLSRIEQRPHADQGVAPTVVRPQRPKPGAVGEASAPQADDVVATADAATQRSTVRRRWAAAAAAAVIIVAAVVWTALRDETPASVDTTASPAGSPAPTRDSTPSPPAAITPSPAPSPPAVAAAPNISIEEQLARVTASQKRGDLQSALSDIRGVLATTSDDRARVLARSLANDARRGMAAAADAARRQKTADQSPATFATAERARTLSDRAFSGNDFVEAGNQAVLATAAYSLAEREAIAAAKQTTPPSAVARTTELLTPVPVPAPSPTPAASPPVVGPGAPPASPSPVAAPPATITPPPAPAPAPAPAAAPPATAAANPGAAATEAARAGMFRALTRYQDAYAARSIKDLEAIFPTMPREDRQATEKQLRSCRGYDVAILNPQYLFNPDDPSSGTVNARATYTCQPPTRQPPIVETTQQTFILRKAGDAWLIERVLTEVQRAR